MQTDRPVCAPCSDSTQCAFGAACRLAMSYDTGTFCFERCGPGGTCPADFTCDGEVCVLDLEGTPWAGCRDYLTCQVPESCDGVDQNCDGVVDDVDPTGPEAAAEIARCRAMGCVDASAVCSGGRWLCTLPPEICGDGRDNDCDGRVDEGCAPPGRGCGAAPAGIWAAAGLLAPFLRRRRTAPNVH